MSMATRSSNLEDRMSEVTLQTEGHAGMQSQHQNGPEETGVTGSPPIPLAILIPILETTAQLS